MNDSFEEMLERAEMLGRPPYDFPLLMSAPMVLGLLREVRGEPGGKRETRRFETPILRAAERAQAEGRGLSAWVREAWQAWRELDDLSPSAIPDDASILYTADRPDSPWDSRRRAAMHMPRRASRLTLLNVTIRRERLGDISEESAIAEGIVWDAAEGAAFVPGLDCCDSRSPVESYIALWEHLHGIGTWETDKGREVMVISFRPVLANIDGDWSRA